MYYSIDEEMARTAHEMNSFRDYQPGSVTKEYKSYVDVAASIAEQKKQEFPNHCDEIDSILDRYSRKLAEWYNEGFRIESMCPSILICGGGNFPTRKKEKQNSRRESHHAELEHIQNILNKLESFGSVIKSGDCDAIDRLQEKLEKLTAFQDKAKKVNAFFRKYKTLEGCTLLTDEQKEKLMAEINDIRFPLRDKPYPSYFTTNNAAEIRRLKARIDQLTKEKNRESCEKSVEISQDESVKVIENTDLMRLQILFDDIPTSEIRDILKSNGFRWSPSNKAWQRILNDNARYAAKEVIELIKNKG